MTTEAQSLIVMIRHPEPGEVKTRLIPSLGAEGAASLYRHFVKDVLRAAEESGVNIRVAYTPGESLNDIKDWLKIGRDSTDPGQSNTTPQINAKWHHPNMTQINPTLTMMITGPEFSAKCP